ncbi:MAG TPA: efflux RND transporter periplasmic adaptor subunit [Alphaproteobacteria bacterium]|nr:efflux RND transporter periplasmic adaptor subunit [Alphaproteobacteria bacterium]
MSAGEGHYICPMHPHIVGEEGDKCPICGMNLVVQNDGEALSEPEHQHGDMKMDEKKSADAVYLCPMHPHITGKEGNDCPICGMHLVPKEDMDSSDQEQDSHNNVEGSIQIDPSYIQTLGVKTTTVKQTAFGDSIRAFGRIAANMRNEQEIAVQGEGWVKTLKTSAVGDVVKKGDLLFTIYSPDLMAAQSDYLISQRTGYKVGNPEQRLRLKGMDDQAIALLKKKGAMMERTPFHAPIDGIITALNIREGSHISDGDVLMTLQDFSSLWVNAEVAVKDLSHLQVGTPATITIPANGDSYESVVDYIHPVANSMSRTATVRLLLDNPEGRLKPDMYVDVAFNADQQNHLAVPSDAVLYGSMGAYVIEDLGNGAFRPVMVKTGTTSGDTTQIRSGLNEGQRIVSSGQFMIDAESNLRGGMSAMDHDMGAM